MNTSTGAPLEALDGPRALTMTHAGDRACSRPGMARCVIPKVSVTPRGAGGCSGLRSKR
jgi:hypothetical protein